jgi:drug/metabolite transporter (DMT)-like permease
LEVERWTLKVSLYSLAVKPESQLHDVASPTPALQTPRDLRRAHWAVLALLIGTLFWGAGFTWAKAAAAALNREAGLPDGSVMGPVLLLVWRFAISGVLWLLIFPNSRRGWTRASFARAGILGGLLGLGVIIQHIGLAHTTEAVSAFLTSMAILFVPLIMTFALRRPPNPVMWVGVILATAGIWLMTGAAPAGFGFGEALGLACAVAFSCHIISVNIIVPMDNPWRMAGGQFLVVGLFALVLLPFVTGGPESLRPAEMFRLVTAPQVWPYLLLLILFPTLLAFGLLILFQPRVTPTRAVIVYMFEPVFATLFAWIVVARVYEPIMLTGAALILVANLLAELLGMRRPRQG